jgi:hypothetical protein
MIKPGDKVIYIGKNSHIHHLQKTGFAFTLGYENVSGNTGIFKYQIGGLNADGDFVIFKIKLKDVIAIKDYRKQLIEELLK